MSLLESSTLSEKLTPQEVAEAFKVSKRTVYKWLRNGEIPGRKFGGVWRTDPDDLEEFIKDGSHPETHMNGSTEPHASESQGEAEPQLGDDSDDG